MQREHEDRNQLSNQLGIVENKHNLVMQCVNAQCYKGLLYLREGRIELLELELQSDDQFRPDEGALAMKSLPSCVFACRECAKAHVTKRWTTSDLVLVFRNQNTASGHPG